MILKASDAAIEQNKLLKVYVVLNLVFFLGEAFVLLFTHAYIFTAVDFEKAGWLLCFAL
jgi:hypothetical protein